MVAYSFKERFIKPIEVGLSSVRLSFDPEPKTQTIRGIGKKRHARPGENVQLYYAQRTKQCRLLGVARCLAAPGIRIFVKQERVEIEAIPHMAENARTLTMAATLDRFAISDGFGDWADMRQFWIDEHSELVRLGPFVGVLVRWEPIR